MQCVQAGVFPSHLICIDADRMTVSNKVDYSSMMIVVDEGNKRGKT